MTAQLAILADHKISVSCDDSRNLAEMGIAPGVREGVQNPMGRSEDPFPKICGITVPLLGRFSRVRVKLGEVDRIG